MLAVLAEVFIDELASGLVLPCPIDGDGGVSPSTAEALPLAPGLSNIVRIVSLGLIAVVRIHRVHSVIPP